MTNSLFEEYTDNSGDTVMVHFQLIATCNPQVKE